MHDETPPSTSNFSLVGSSDFWHPAICFQPTSHSTRSPEPGISQNSNSDLSYPRRTNRMVVVRPRQMSGAAVTVHVLLFALCCCFLDQKVDSFTPMISFETNGMSGNALLLPFASSTSVTPVGLLTSGIIRALPSHSFLQASKDGNENVQNDEKVTKLTRKRPQNYLPIRMTWLNNVPKKMELTLD